MMMLFTYIMVMMLHRLWLSRKHYSEPNMFGGYGDDLRIDHGDYLGIVYGAIGMD